MSENETVQVPTWAFKLLPIGATLVVSALTAFQTYKVTGLEDSMAKNTAKLDKLEGTVHSVQSSFSTRMHAEQTRATAEETKLALRITKVEAAIEASKLAQAPKRRR